MSARTALAPARPAPAAAPPDRVELGYCAGVPMPTLAQLRARFAPAVPQSFSAAAVTGYYLQDDHLSPAGAALFERVRHKYLDPVPASSNLTLYLTGGLPGSGKGAVTRQLTERSHPFVDIDADEIKTDILADLATRQPALRAEMQNCKEWAGVVHKVSRVMAHELMEAALSSGKDLLFDSTLAAPNQQEYRDFVEGARARGYRAEAHMCDVAVATAQERVQKRAATPELVPLPEGTLTLPGRYVPPQLVEAALPGLEQNRKAFLDEGLFDGAFLYDTNGRQPVLEASYRRVDLPGGGHTSQPV